MFKKILSTGAALALLLVAACTQGSNDTESGSDLADVTVAQWGSEKYLIYLPLYVAQERGFFADHGVSVTVEYSGNDDQVFAKVLRGDAQFGVGDPIFTAVSRQRGAEGVVLASVVDRVALWGISTSDQTIERPADFSGLRVGTFPRPSTNYTLMRNTLAQDSVVDARVVEVPIGSEIALLESGGADIVMLLEPAASIAESNGYHVVTSFPELWGAFTFTGLTSTEQIVDQDPEVARAMIAGLQDAVDFIYSETDQTVDLAATLFPSLDRGVVTQAVQRMIDDQTIPRDVGISEEAWLNSIRTRQEVGDIEQGFDCLECINFAPQ